MRLFALFSGEHFLSLLRVIWRATCTAAVWLSLRLQTLCSSSEWRATLLQGFCTSTNTTLHTGTASQSLQLYLHSSLLMSKKGRIHLCVLCSPCWSLPTTTSWCCLSEFQKLQHQWFCCGGWTPLALSLQCSGFQVKELPVCGGGELKQSDLFSQNTENRINWQVI